VRDARARPRHCDGRVRGRRARPRDERGRPRRVRRDSQRGERPRRPHEDRRARLLLLSSRLNARDFFDTAGGDATTPLVSGTQPVVSASAVSFNPSTFTFDPVGGATPVNVRGSGDGGEDSFTLGQGGFVLGGPAVPGRVFFFVSAERQVLNASKEESFAVPTVAQRGASSTGASGVFRDPFTAAPTFAFSSTRGGDAVFSLFPFPNNAAGVYGENTFTRQLPANARGLILSGKLDANIKSRAMLHTLAGRYNFTDDWRDIPSTGGALFSPPRSRSSPASRTSSRVAQSSAGYSSPPRAATARASPSPSTPTSTLTSTATRPTASTRRAASTSRATACGLLF